MQIKIHWSNLCICCRVPIRIKEDQSVMSHQNQSTTHHIFCGQGRGCNFPNHVNGSLDFIFSDMHPFLLMLFVLQNLESIDHWGKMNTYIRKNKAQVPGTRKHDEQKVKCTSRHSLPICPHQIESHPTSLWWQQKYPFPSKPWIKAIYQTLPICNQCWPIQSQPCPVFFFAYTLGVHKSKSRCEIPLFTISTSKIWRRLRVWAAMC